MCVAKVFSIYMDIFAAKKVSSFCNAKATHIFCSKNINVFENILAATVYEFVINKLIKLTMLWITWPWCFLKKKNILSSAFE